ncbi:unnamed protein product [Calypogeia fissa]
MVKLRMTTVDVAAEVRCLRKLIGFRCANIYDLSPKTYVIKFAKSSGVAESGESEKALVLLESGVRLHTTEFSRDKSSTPSGFTLKLRKYLRTQRLEDVRQLGIDRVVDFQFGLGETAHHVMLELYAQGNLVVTDAKYNILQILRTWKDEEKGLSMMVHQRYPVDSCRLLQRTTEEKLDALFRAPIAAPQLEGPEKPGTGSGDQDGKKVKAKWGKDAEGKGSKGSAQETEGSGNKEAGGRATLKGILGEGLGYGPILIEHIILDAALQPNMKIAGDGTSAKIAADDFKALAAAVKRFEDWLESVVGGELMPGGYIFMQKANSGKKQSLLTEVKPDSEKVQVYDEFYPLVLKQLEERDHRKFETFDAAMDEFFSKVEGQRAQQQRKAQEDAALGKLEKIRADQTNRVKALEKEVDQSVRMAELIEYNLDDVDAAILAVRTALASGMDWKNLERMVKEEKKAGNPVAGLIHNLRLETNQITLLLSNNLDDMDEEEKTRPVDKVVVDLALSAHANARYWFETKKRHATKQEKTLAAHEKAFKAAEKKTQQTLAQAKTVAAITHIRKVHWFEKFNWFISSENFLVISGRDAQQNELLVKRYMKKGDLYVHADLHGASSTIIKNRDQNHPIPPLTINQAGCFTMCRSQAWDSKIVTSAWWVEAHQVTKTAPTGEYLTVGSFMVRGKKNFLPPNPLVMGYGFLFRLDDSSIAGHLNERQVRGEDDDEAYEDSVADGDSQPIEASVDSQEEDGDSDPPSQDPKGNDILSETITTSQENAEEGDESAQNPTAIQGDDGMIETADSSELDGLLDKALEVRSAPKAAKGSSKYGVEDLSTNDTDSHDHIFELLNVSKGVQREKPYVSKAERRKLKKGGKQKQTDDLEEEMIASNELQDMEETNNGTEEASANAREEKGADAGANKPGRGRKGKLKKIKEKYAEQDEEERQLRMELLASAGRKEAKKVGENEKDVKGTSQLPIKSDAKVELDIGGKVCYKCKRAGHIARDCPFATEDDAKETKDEIPPDAVESGAVITDKIQELNIDATPVVQGSQQQEVPNKTGKTEGLSRRAHAKAAKNEIAAIMAEENVLELDEDEKEKLTELDSLTGKPLPSDVLLYAVPVCGPYTALQGFKYRVKLTPGTAKRGKAAKTAVDVFTRLPEVTAREKELMKAVTDPELVACMIGNAKVTAPGLSKLKQQTKKKPKKVPAL